MSGQTFAILPHPDSAQYFQVILKKQFELYLLTTNVFRLVQSFFPIEKTAFVYLIFRHPTIGDFISVLSFWSSSSRRNFSCRSRQKAQILDIKDLGLVVGQRQKDVTPAPYFLTPQADSNQYSESAGYRSTNRDRRRNTRHRPRAGSASRSCFPSTAAPV